MNRNETLPHLLRIAKSNGFELRRWFQANISPEWPGQDRAVAMLATEGRLPALIFSHEFARAFWRQGAQMSFVVPASTYSRMNGKGQVVTVHRKPFTRRTVKAGVWQYHLRKMVLSADPVRYLEKFLPPEAEGPLSSVEEPDLLAAS